MSRKILILATLLLIILYVLFPYYAAYSLFSTIQEGDQYKLNRSVDFEKIRESLKEQLNSKIIDVTKKNKGFENNPFVAGLTLAFLPKIVNSVIDAYITPSGVASLINKGKIENNANSISSNSAVTKKTEANTIDLRKINYAFFSNPTMFLVEINDVKLIFKFKDWWWKLNEIILPDFSESAKQIMNRNRSDIFLAKNKKVDDSLRKKLNAEKMNLIKEIQLVLSHLNYNPGAVDGVLGSATQKAIESFQSDAELTKNVKATKNLLQELKLYEKKKSYMDKVIIRDFKVAQGRKYSFDDPKPAIFGTVVNNGRKTLKEVKITIYFQDLNGTTISEKDYYPVLVTKYSYGDDNKPLKPNYVKDFGYSVEDSAPSSWGKKAIAKITNIEFYE